MVDEIMKLLDDYKILSEVLGNRKQYEIQFKDFINLMIVIELRKMQIHVDTHRGKQVSLKDHLP